MSINNRGDPFDSPTFGKSLSLKVDGGFNAISINPSARDVVLASRQGLYIIDLDDPFSPPRWLHHETPWQVADVQWCPHPAKPHWVVSTSNQKAIIWNLNRSSSDAIEYALHGHSRAITDINFNPQEPDILATCSVDTYVHAWDLRSPKRPFYSTSPWRSSASQVKWNHKDSNIMASSHGNDVFIWDLRNGSTPLVKLEGHKSSVNSIDFNRFKSSEIMSSSNDGTVKFWDYSRCVTNSIKTVQTDFPIWRGRYLPFGKGYCVMPMVGGDNSVYLMNLDDTDHEEEFGNTDCVEKASKLQPIYTFKGHSDRVIDFLWRSRHSHDTFIDDREFELVTWSKDCSLRLWPISDILYDKVNFERNKRLEEKLPDYQYMTYNREVKGNVVDNSNDYKRVKENFVTTSGLTNMNNVNHLNWLSGVRMNDEHSPADMFEEPKLHNLGEEVSAIGHKFPKVVFEKISVSTGELVLTLNGPWDENDPDEYIFLRIEVKIPADYPCKGNAPRFRIEENDKLTSATKQKMMKKLNEITELYTDSGLYCLEQCLHYLLGEEVSMDLERSIDEPLFYLDVPNVSEFNDFSSVTGTDMTDASVESSSDSENGVFKSAYDDGAEIRNTFGRNLAMDSTPVPNECGAIWTSTGQLLTFFSTDNKVDRKQRTSLKLTREQLETKAQEELKSDKDNVNNMLDGQPSDVRPKRYVDTLVKKDAASHVSDSSSSEESDSDDSFGSFVDDWNDIVGNDIVARTQVPALLGNFGKSFGSVHSESVKTGDSSRVIKNVIMVNDFSNLITESKDLALQYDIMTEFPEEMARHNALAAEKYGYEEISHCWQILSDMLMAEKTDSFTSFTWNSNPLGIKWFMKEAIVHFELEGNIQMLSMLYCVVANLYRDNLESSESYNVQDSYKSLVSYNFDDSKEVWKSDVNSQYSTNNTINSQGDMSYKSKILASLDNHSIRSDEIAGVNQYLMGTRVANSRAMPTSKRNSNIGFPTPIIPALTRVTDISVELIHDDVLESFRNSVHEILEPNDIIKCKRYVLMYAKLLYRWGLPMERVKLLKMCLLSSAADLHDDMFTASDLNRVNNNSIEVNWITSSKTDNFVASCNYCNLRIKGNMFVCGNCQHIMHMDCAKKWWAIGNECPSGCGCHCPNEYDVSP
ncbi:Mtc5 protein [Maudiozyma humilis]|uniref:Mtc5 protein n=1 Tax=Maudiozyma humilis TaxID=51915 RepID=A0AAV5RXY8_MAUHU|nr:Mtc5 protein [Kazachstania humilis]